MKRSTLLVLVLLLAVLGIADSAYLTHAAVTGNALACGIAGLDGCNVVAQSTYSKLLGIPLAEYGLVFYGAVLLLAIIAFTRPSKLVRNALLLFGVVGALFSLYFIVLQVFVIKALCVYCLGSFVLATLICAFTYLVWKRASDPPAIPAM